MITHGLLFFRLYRISIRCICKKKYERKGKLFFRGRGGIIADKLLKLCFPNISFLSKIISCFSSENSSITPVFTNYAASVVDMLYKQLKRGSKDLASLSEYVTYANFNLILNLRNAPSLDSVVREI